MKRCLLIANRCFFKKNSGHEVALAGYCQRLHDKYGYLVDVVFTKDVDVDAPYYINDIVYFKKTSKITLMANCIKNILRFKPLQNSLLCNTSNFKQVERILASNEYNIVFVDMIRMAPFYEITKKYCSNQILILEDLLSKRYKAMRANSGKGSVMGYYSNKVPKLLNFLVQSEFLKNLLLWYEGIAVEKQEKLYSDKYQHITFVADSEAQSFNEKYGTNRAIKLGLGIDYEYFSEVHRKPKFDDSLVFLGNMKVAANQDSVRYIANDVLPLVKKATTLDVIGTYNEEFKKEFAGSNINFLGRIEDVRDVMAEKSVFLAPIAYGSGIKTKIIEAMAMGIPVVTNAVGTENIDAVNGRDYIVENTSQMLAKTVDSLLNDTKKAEQIGLNGQKFAKENFMWEKVLSNFDVMGVRK